jgi:hypothetical protein
MKTYLTLFIVVCQSVVALAQDNDNKTPYLTKSLANDAINSVVVTTSAGGIVVSGQSGQAPRVEVYIKGNNDKDISKEEIKKRLEEYYDLDISVSGHEVRAIAKNKKDGDWDWKKGLSISFKIYVPEHSNTDLTTSGGGISLDNLSGNEDFKTSGGGLNIDKLSGKIHGVTSGGGILVSNSSETIELVTSGGGITAKNCTGDIKLHTSGGGLRLEHLKGTIHAYTSGGGVEGNDIEGELVTSTSGGGIDLKEMNCSLSASTSAGSLNAEMKQVGKYLKLACSAGNINIELPAKQGLDLDLKGDRVNQSQFSGFNGDWDKYHVKGTVNGGGSPVTADASSGNINVKFN